MNDRTSEFGKVRSVLWPIHNFELKKFIPMSLLMFSILFVYSAVRDLKDVFIQNYATLGGAELIAPLKGIFVLPIALMTAFIFSFLVGKFGIDKTFYLISSFFTIFFFVFAFFLFPNVSKIHLNEEVMIKMREVCPGFLYYVIPCIGNWSYSLFFILAETWGSVMISSFFWYFANQVTKESEVNRFYAFYSMVGSVGRLISGRYIEQMSYVKNNEEFDKNVKFLICTASFACIVTILLYYYINKVVCSDQNMRPLRKKTVDAGKSKTKVKFLEGIKYLVSSKYLFLIFLLSISYGVGINLLEGIFKGHIKEMSVNPNDTGRVMGRISQTTACFNIMLTFLCSYILRKFKWKQAALVTPIVLVSLGVVFFSLMLYLNYGKGNIVDNTLLANIAMWVGISVDSFTKGTKYCLFDTTRGIAYRPLSPQEQAQGQGAVEIIGGRFGKGLGATITMMFTSILFPGSKILSHIGSFFILFLIILIIWIFSCNKLGNLYEEKISKINGGQYGK